MVGEPTSSLVNGTLRLHSLPVQDFTQVQPMLLLRSFLLRQNIPLAFKAARPGCPPNLTIRAVATMATDPTKYKLNHSM